MQYNLSSILFEIVVHLQWRNYGALKTENFAIVNVPLFKKNRTQVILHVEGQFFFKFNIWSRQSIVAIANL